MLISILLNHVFGVPIVGAVICHNIFSCLTWNLNSITGQIHYYIINMKSSTQPVQGKFRIKCWQVKTLPVIMAGVFLSIQ